MSTQITPFTANYPSGKIISITVPATVTSGERTYIFTKWEDNTTSLIRQITITANETISVTYTIVPQFTLTIVGGTGGTVSPVAGTYPVDQGTTVSMVATAGADYNFAYWIVNGTAQPSLTNPTYSFAMTANTSIQPYFLAKIVNLTVSAGANGTVTLPDATIVAAGTSITKAYSIGTTYNFTATPNTVPYPGYYLDHWELPVGTSQGTTNPIGVKITSVMNGQTLKALFTQTPYTTITMTVAKVRTGTVNPYGTLVLNVDPNTIVSFVATDVLGWTFNHWILPDGSTSTNRTLQMYITAALNGTTLTAVFVQIYYELTINSTPIGIPITITEIN